MITIIDHDGQNSACIEHAYYPNINEPPSKRCILTYPYTRRVVPIFFFMRQKDPVRHDKERRLIENKRVG